MFDSLQTSGLGDSVSETSDSMPAEIWLSQPDAMAAFTPSEGFCCTAFRVRLAGVWRSILAEPPSWFALQARPAFYGNPLLFPYPYDIVGGRFRYRGEGYVLQPGRTGRAAHGFVRDHQWTVERVWDDAMGAHVCATITNEAVPALLEEFPFPLRFTVTYSLSGTRLSLSVEVANVGDSRLPFGFGIHPYFPIGDGSTTRLARCRLVSNLRSTAVLGPGHASVAFAPVPEGENLQTGLLLSDLLQRRATMPRAGLREIYTDLGDPPEVPSDGIRCTLTDGDSGMSIKITTDDSFRTLYLFTPRDATVISPVIGTCLPNALNLADDGYPSGLRELAPTASWTGAVTIAVSNG